MRFGRLEWHASKAFTGDIRNMPTEISDRDADCWEPLLAIADAAGGEWPELAREAAVFLVRRGKDGSRRRAPNCSASISLRPSATTTGYGRRNFSKYPHDRPESPWAEDGRKPELNGRRLATMLRGYGIKSKDVRIGDLTARAIWPRTSWMTGAAISIPPRLCAHDDIDVTLYRLRFPYSPKPRRK